MKMETSKQKRWGDKLIPDEIDFNTMALQQQTKKDPRVPPRDLSEETQSTN